MRSVLETLRDVPFLKEIDEAAVVDVARHCVEKVVLRNESVFHEGDAPLGLIVVREGAVKIYKTGEGGREQILEIEGPGRSVAELPLFDGRPYPASCAAVHDSVLLVVRTREFHEMLDRHPALSRAVIATLALRMRRLVMLVQELSLRDVRHRLVDLLRELAAGRDAFELDLSHQELAARIGTVREIVSRMLAKLAQDGVLRVEGKTVTLLKPDRRP
ncbi:MAG TPA: Crp/Fnr family transcriptional regulator [Candidatus Sulfotelmatobacter sp.]|jgi:CRP/FNR family transcriptional regulator|nr:Crp/Fnr family transcriptional regulator [Candidatus Sulfotelmatobacter sp.]